MSTLLEQAVRAHGGIDHWNTLRTASAVLDIGGAIWPRKGQPDMFREIELTASLRHQQVEIAAPAAGWRGTFTPDVVRIDAPGSVALAEYVHKERERDLLFHAANGPSPLDH